MARIPLPTPDSLDALQRQVYDKVVSGPRGKLRGPFRAGADWDCHAHVFGPYNQYPLAAGRSYTPPEATQDDYLRVLAQLELQHAVLVQPSAYADDYTLVLDSLRRQPHWRGVLVSPQAPVSRMREWYARGVRGLRFSHRSGGNFAGSALLTDLQSMAPRMADAGLHAEVWTDCSLLREIAPLLQDLPVPVVLDHMAGFDHRTGLDAPGFVALCNLLQSDRVWVKLVAYRNLHGVSDPSAGAPFQQRLCEVNPNQLVWGSDWPHLNLKPMPATSALLDQFRLWCCDATLVRRILVDNPQRLYR